MNSGVGARIGASVGVALVLALSSGVADAQPGLVTAARTQPLRRSGLFHQGISVEPLNLGALQAVTSHGHASGIDVGISLHYDLGPNWSLHMPIELGEGGFGGGEGYGELAIVPGVLYRFRDRDDQRWVPYVGGGLRAGYAGVGKTLLGQPLVVACCHDWGEHSGGGGAGDPDVEDGSAAGAEAWAGIEWNRTRWFSLQLAGAVAYERIAATSVIVFRETLGFRLSI